MQFNEVIEYFTELGAKLHISQNEFCSKLEQVDTFIFDWDGVFNKGIKMNQVGSPFSEPDSMGTNLMRFSYYLKFGTLPKIGIMTGAQNEGALYLANREHYDFIIRGFTDKNEALKLLLKEYQISSEKSLFVWDDVLDLPVAKWAGTSIQIARQENPILNDYARLSGCVDYTTSTPGGKYAVREISNLYLAANGNGHACIENRMAYNNLYRTYLTKRNAGIPVQIRKN
jgi:3-deoxy-D-manno-octulosonate 8-phosphate phosphatase (KDO 8-P phosphatase)